MVGSEAVEGPVAYIAGVGVRIRFRAGRWVADAPRLAVERSHGNWHLRLELAALASASTGCLGEPCGGGLGTAAPCAAHGAGPGQPGPHGSRGWPTEGVSRGRQSPRLLCAPDAGYVEISGDAAERQAFNFIEMAFDFAIPVEVFRDGSFLLARIG